MTVKRVCLVLFILLIVFGVISGITGAYETNEIPLVVATLRINNWAGTFEDIIENIELEWDRKWSFEMNPEIAENNFPIISPKIEVLTDINLVRFYPDDPNIFDADPENDYYIWYFENLEFSAPTICSVVAWEEVDIFYAKPGYSASRSVEPQILTEDETLQTVTVTFELEDAFPEEVNGFSIWVGIAPIAYEDDLLVEGEIVSQVPVDGFNERTDIVQAFWEIDLIENEIEIGKTYEFEATIKSTKSPDLIGSPLFKPFVGIQYGRWIFWESEVDTSVTVEDPYNTLKVIFSADNNVEWLPNFSDHSYDFGFLSVISEITVPPDEEPPPYYVLTPADVEIHPETLSLSSLGVFTAYVQLPSPYSVHDIDISTVVCEGAEAIRGSIKADILTLHFWRQDLHDIELGEEVEFMITGKLTDGTLFEGKDKIRVLD